MSTANAIFSPQIPSFALAPPDQQTIPIAETAPVVVKTPAKVRAPATVKAPAKVKTPTSPPVVPEPPPVTGTFTCKAPEEQETFQPSRFALSEAYRSEDADFTIWSSDVISFKVHSYHLKAASPYFRDLMKDPKITTLIVPTSGYSGTKVVKDIELAFQVITLATEWKCEAVLKILKKDLAIQALINNTQGPSNQHFRLAHKLGDLHLMALIAQRDRVPGPNSYLSEGTKPDGTGRSKIYDKAAPGLVGFEGIESPAFELGRLSYGAFIGLPPTVLWALARSTYLARKDHGAVDVDEMAQLFEELLRLAYSDPASVSNKVVAASSPPITPTTAPEAGPLDQTSSK